MPIRLVMLSGDSPCARSANRPAGGVPSDMSAGSGVSGAAAARWSHSAGSEVAGSMSRPDTIASRRVQARGGHPHRAVPAAPNASHRPPVGPAAVDAQVQVGQRVLPVRVGAVLGDQHVGPERPYHPGTTAWNARNHDASPVPAGTAMFTEVPPAAPSPQSVGKPVPGNKGQRALVCADAVQAPAFARSGCPASGEPRRSRRSSTGRARGARPFGHRLLGTLA